jgi:alkylhydroperoxidase family enzyme
VSAGATAATWLELPPGETGWDRFVALCPNEVGAVADLVVAAWAENDPVHLELCRIRMATALGFTSEQARRTERARAAGLTEAKAADLPSWPSSDRFSPTERACLALAEQFVMDANAVTEANVADVTAHLGPEGCYAFVHAVSVLETFMRACLTLGIDAIPDVDVLAAARAAERAAAATQEATR